MSKLHICNLNYSICLLHKIIGWEYKAFSENEIFKKIYFSKGLFSQAISCLKQFKKQPGHLLVCNICKWSHFSEFILDTGWQVYACTMPEVFFFSIQVKMSGTLCTLFQVILSLGHKEHLLKNHECCELALDTIKINTDSHFQLVWILYVFTASPE